VRIAFDENTPRVVAHAIKLIAEAEMAGSTEPLEVVHAHDLVARGTFDVPLIQQIADGTHRRAALITSDKSMRTRQHERAAFTDTGCIGIVLRGGWNHASMWERARYSLLWWTTWMEAVASSAPGMLWQCPWSTKPKALQRF
jgi:hypothetical protein